LIWTVRDSKNVSDKVLLLARDPVRWDYFQLRVVTATLSGDVALAGTRCDAVSSDLLWRGGVNPVGDQAAAERPTVSLCVTESTSISAAYQHH
jgi:hypothetical protein